MPPKGREYYIYSKTSGEAIAVVNSREEAREIARTVGRANVETTEQRERREARTVKRYEHAGKHGYQIGSEDGDAPLRFNSALRMLVSKFGDYQKVTFAFRGTFADSYGQRKAWIGSVDMAGLIKQRLREPAPANETFGELAARVFGFASAPTSIYEIVAVPAHEG